MQTVTPSVIARQQLQDLLTGGDDRGSNIISARRCYVTEGVLGSVVWFCGQMARASSAKAPGSR